MAKKQATDGAQVEARVLLDCSWGAADDVVTLSKDEADAGVAAGELDTNTDAVAYAKRVAAVRQQADA